MTRTRALYLVAIAIATLAGVAFAQDAVPLETPSGASPLLLLVIGGAVSYLRSTPIFARIDGPATVPLFALVVGGALGGVLAPLGMIETEATAMLGSPFAGIAAGILAAVETVFGVSLVKYVAKVFRRSPEGKLEVDVRQTLEVAREVSGAKPTGPVSTAVAFVLDTAERILGQPPTGTALVALYPMIVKWAQSPVVLTDEIRAKIQTDVLGALSRGGLVGPDLV